MFFKKNKQAQQSKPQEASPSRPFATQGQSLFAPGLNPTPARVDFGLSQAQSFSSPSTTTLDAQTMPSQPGALPWEASAPTIPDTTSNAAPLDWEMPPLPQAPLSQMPESQLDYVPQQSLPPLDSGYPAPAAPAWETSHATPSEPALAYPPESFSMGMANEAPVMPFPTPPTAEVQSWETPSWQPSAEQSFSQPQPSAEDAWSGMEAASQAGYESNLAQNDYGQLGTAVNDESGISYENNQNAGLSDFGMQELPFSAEPSYAPPDQMVPPSQVGESFWSSLNIPDAAPGEQIPMDPGAFLDSVGEQLYPQDPFLSHHPDMAEGEQAFEEAAQFLFPETMGASLDWSEDSFESDFSPSGGFANGDFEGSSPLIPSLDLGESIQTETDGFDDISHLPEAEMYSAGLETAEPPALSFDSDLSTFLSDTASLSEETSEFGANVQLGSNYSSGFDPAGAFDSAETIGAELSDNSASTWTPSGDEYSGEGVSLESSWELPESGESLSGYTLEPSFQGSGLQSEEFHAMPAANAAGANIEYGLGYDVEESVSYELSSFQSSAEETMTFLAAPEMTVPQADAGYFNPQPQQDVSGGLEGFSANPANEEAFFVAPPIEISEAKAGEHDFSGSTSGAFFQDVSLADFPLEETPASVHSPAPADQDFYATSFSLTEDGNLIPDPEGTVPAAAYEIPPQPMPLPPLQNAGPAPMMDAVSLFNDEPELQPLPDIAAGQPETGGGYFDSITGWSPAEQPGVQHPPETVSTFEFQEENVTSGFGSGSSWAEEEAPAYSLDPVGSITSPMEVPTAPVPQVPLPSPVIQQPLPQMRSVPLAEAVPPVTPPGDLEAQWDSPPASVMQPAAPSAPQPAAQSGLTLGNLEILSVCPLKEHMRLLIVHTAGMFALMGQVGQDQPNIAVLKVFEHNPIAYQNTFAAVEEGQTGSQGMYLVQVGTWRAIISTFQDKITLHTELG